MPFREGTKVFFEPKLIPTKNPINETDGVNGRPVASWALEIIYSGIADEWCSIMRQS